MKIKEYDIFKEYAHLNDQDFKKQFYASKSKYGLQEYDLISDWLKLMPNISEDFRVHGPGWIIDITEDYYE